MILDVLTGIYFNPFLLRKFLMLSSLPSLASNRNRYLLKVTEQQIGTQHN